MNAALRWPVAIALGLLPCRDAVGSPPVERLPLFDARDTKGWSIAESSLEPVADRAPDGSPCLHWHVTVDHTSGEAKYPIGWPRFGRSIPEGSLRDWSAWDSLHFWLRADTSREALPREPVGLGLQTPDKASSFQRSLSELRKGEWVELDIPLREIPRHGDVRQLQFHISESKYQHGDTLDLLIAGPELRRPAQPILLDLLPECAVMYADAPRIPVRFRLAGVRPGERAEVDLSLRHDGKCLIDATSRLERGEHRIELERGGAALAPGEYEIEARIAGLPENAVGRVRLVESPWVR